MARAFGKAVGHAPDVSTHAVNGAAQTVLMHDDGPSSQRRIPRETADFVPTVPGVHAPPVGPGAMPLKYAASPAAVNDVHAPAPVGLRSLPGLLQLGPSPKEVLIVPLPGQLAVLLTAQVHAHASPALARSSTSVDLNPAGQ